FPACRDDADVMRHLEEYFAGVRVPRVLGLGLEVAEHVPFGARVTAVAARRNITRMARQLIAGATPAEALPRLARLWRAGEAATVDLLGEKIVTAGEADRYAGRLAATLDALVVAAGAWPERRRPGHDPWGVGPRIHGVVRPTGRCRRFGPLTACA